MKERKKKRRRAYRIKKITYKESASKNKSQDQRRLQTASQEKEKNPCKFQFESPESSPHLFSNNYVIVKYTWIKYTHMIICELSQTKPRHCFVHGKRGWKPYIVQIYLMCKRNKKSTYTWYIKIARPMCIQMFEWLFIRILFI